jgi:hypothetical protein
MSPVGKSRQGLACLNDPCGEGRRIFINGVCQKPTNANDAAFLLGRLEETAQHSELALTWYERCLTESPHGTYVSEGLGRKMTVIQRLHGDDRARPVAEEYLRRFGNGTYAAAARALTRAP